MGNDDTKVESEKKAAMKFLIDFKAWVTDDTCEHYKDRRIHEEQGHNKQSCLTNRSCDGHEFGQAKNIDLHLVGERQARAVVQRMGDAREPQKRAPAMGSPPREINLISSGPLGHVSDIKLIRTDTTLDLSQKAEKGMIFLVTHAVFYYPTCPGARLVMALWDKSTLTFLNPYAPCLILVFFQN
ncbi:uncharacterized protein LOC133882703 [Alnus glutinosa]|uniref:uncharacterized protein LOC133882703 n=1 Tax=Alnus glutinosa TaxID=3517 RepID=UPI002D77AE1F|nr:uncharacterized protein LOC133882703 [Alnus glutinosa]